MTQGSNWSVGAWEWCFTVLQCYNASSLRSRALLELCGSEPCQGRVWDQQDFKLCLLETCTIVLLTAVAGKF